MFSKKKNWKGGMSQLIMEAEDETSAAMKEFISAARPSPSPMIKTHKLNNHSSISLASQKSAEPSPCVRAVSGKCSSISGGRTSFTQKRQNYQAQQSTTDSPSSSTPSISPASRPQRRGLLAGLTLKSRRSASSMPSAPSETSFPLISLPLRTTSPPLATPSNSLSLCSLSLPSTPQQRSQLLTSAQVQPVLRVACDSRPSTPSITLSCNSAEPPRSLSQIPKTLTPVFPRSTLNRPAPCTDRLSNDLVRILDITPRPVTKISRIKFEAHVPCDSSEITKAQQCWVVNERGEKLKFGKLVGSRMADGPWLLVFVRQFGYSYCQKYLKDLEMKLRQAQTGRQPLKAIVIGNGSHLMIRKFKEITATKFDVYSDESNRRELYKALGMCLRTVDTLRDQQPSMGLGIRGNGALSKQQLGGEFIFESTLQGRRSSKVNDIDVDDSADMRHQTGHSPTASFSDSGESCLTTSEKIAPRAGDVEMTYAHRMRHMHDHAPLEDVVLAAGL